MFWFHYIAKLIKILNKDATPAQIAGGFAFGAMVGLIPKFNLLALLICIAILLIRVNIAIAVLATGLFAIVGAITDPFVEQLGYLLLTDLSALRGVWTFLYNLPVVPWTGFNNSLVLGNFVLGLALFVPLFVGMKAFVGVYRSRLRDRLAQWKVFQLLKASKLYQLYQRFGSKD